MIEFPVAAQWTGTKAGVRTCADIIIAPLYMKLNISISRVTLI